MKNRNFKVWNFELYAMLKHELVILCADGSCCSIIGDYNTHVGNDLNGIVDNNPDVYYEAYFKASRYLKQTWVSVIGYLQDLIMLLWTAIQELLFHTWI